MKYIVQVEIDPETGTAVEGDPEQLQEWVGMWQALNPIGMYFAMTRRATTIIVDVPNEDALLEALHATWDLTRSYPDVWPVADVDEFGELAQRVGLGQ